LSAVFNEDVSVGKLFRAEIKFRKIGPCCGMKQMLVSPMNGW
jgi:hypothetical protein